jgi:hypothetical protein
MATDEIVKLLIAERNKLDAAIRALSDSGVESHGKTVSAAVQESHGKTGKTKRVISDEARAKMAEAQQARWAKVRKAAKKAVAKEA